MNLPHNHSLQLGHLDAVRESRRERESEKDEHDCSSGCDRTDKGTTD